MSLQAMSGCDKQQTTAFMAWRHGPKMPKVVHPDTGVLSIAPTLLLTASSIPRRYITEQDIKMFHNIPVKCQNCWPSSIVLRHLAFFNINTVGLWISLPSQKLRNKIWTNNPKKIQEEGCAIADFLGQTSSSTCCHDPRYSSSFRFATLQEKMRSNMPRKKREREGKSYEIN